MEEGSKEEFDCVVEYMIEIKKKKSEVDDKMFREGLVVVVERIVADC